MELNTLQRIKPPGVGRSALQVSQEILSLIKTEYHYHTNQLCTLLLCDRQWIDATLRPEVRHIFINRYFREYIMDHAPLSSAEKEHLMGGYYFYSLPSLQHFWQENAVAECKTRLFDLADYQKGGFTAELSHELEFHRFRKPCAAEKERHLGRMRELLTDEGYMLYLSSLYGKRCWAGAPLPPLEESLPLTNLADIRQKHDLHSNTAAMNYLVQRCGVRIKLGSRALWLLPDTTGFRVPLPLPANVTEPRI